MARGPSVTQFYRIGVTDQICSVARLCYFLSFF
nr:MAG TPA: hypothetical protein [Inoviridae sp.]